MQMASSSSSSSSSGSSWWMLRRIRRRWQGFMSCATAEEATENIDASHLTAIVTGASSGIGYETTRVLALRGARVVMAVRNVEAGERAKQSILEGNSNARLLVLKLDLSSMQSVHEFCEMFNSMNLPLNILINNGGVMGGPFTLSNDGVELQFATNYLGHFLLSKLLLQAMISTTEESQVEGRIINVASDAHLFAFVCGSRYELLSDEKSYSPYNTYAKSKLANILHANELSRHLKQEGVNVTINSANPGIIVTSIIRNYPFLVAIAPYVERILELFFLKTIPQGAATQCFAALHPSMKGVSGKYLQNCNFSWRSPSAKDPILARKLWNLSEGLVAKFTR